MADIAFLLLIFFLVTTTITKEEGIPTTLPSKQDQLQQEEIEVKKRDVFNVKANKNNDLLVEDKIVEVKELKDMAIEFYTDPFTGPDKANFPLRRYVDEQKCQEQVAEWQKQVDEYPDNNYFEFKLKDWKGKLETVQLIGPYYEMPPAAIIYFEADNATSYDFYIQITDQLNAAINQLRDDASKNLFGVAFSELDETEESDQPKIKAIRNLYPLRIAEKTK